MLGFIELSGIAWVDWGVAIYIYIYMCEIPMTWVIGSFDYLVVYLHIYNVLLMGKYMASVWTDVLYCITALP